MKGVVFTEFFEMVEEIFGYEMVDHIIEETNLESNGIYTAVGTYDHSEIVSLVVALHKKSEIPVSQLLEKFGHHLYGTFSKNYPNLIEGADTAFDMLSSIEDHIHVEVKKLYPDAQLPHFQIERKDDQHLVMIYRSDRKMADLAYGLINACLDSYATEAEVTKTLLDEEGSLVRFEIVKTN